MKQRSCKQAYKQASTDDCSEEPVKKLKFEVINDTKLTDLNYDSLYSIFKLLTIYDAFKMLEINEKFSEPINRIVRKLNVENTFTLSENAFCHDRPAFYRHLIYVSYTQLKYIGQSISKILIDYDGSFKGSVSVIEESMVEYCTELTELQLVNCRSAPFETIKTSIAKLEVLHLNNCILGPVFSQFSKWLPQLRTLTVMNCKVVDKSYIRNMGTKMPALEYIHLDDVQNVCFNKLNEKVYHLCNVEDIIKGNGHVKHFRSLSDKKPRRLRLISKAMERLETLDLQIQTKHFKGSSHTSVNFKWVTKLVLKISGENWWRCPLVFDVLEELEINCDNFVENWIFFARANQLKKFKLVAPPYRLLGQNLLKISSTWPSLIEVSTNIYGNVDVDEIIEFIHSFSNLHRFDIVKHFLNEVEVKLSDEYKLLPSTDEYYCSFIRSITKIDYENKIIC